MFLWVGEKGKEMLFENIKKVETRGRRHVADDHLKSCHKCGHVWEKLNQRIHGMNYIVYPFGAIPRLGKKKSICPRCKKKVGKI